MFRTLALLAVLAGSPVAQAASPTVAVHSPSGQAVKVPVPKSGDVALAQARLIRLSPRGDAAAVQFCLDVSFFGILLCEVDLVRPGGQILRLKGGAVEGQLLWSSDGKYLIGAGGNTLRLWNLVGGRRLTVVNNFGDGPQTRTDHISKMWWQGDDLCVQAQGTVWKAVSSKGRQGKTTTFTARFTVPHLQPVKAVARLACSSL
ncbi:MAG: hypothetical protein Q4C89_10115 [Deinococcus sp.]|uniref:hypothetical protein n=1 Tax=Deinococcus sp. TaxID=47478 RepID=UPI0026DC7370|nr:hypothetical protein [Deinococcus sp.]MDO4246366.1 hypothetical protein [Deinococcus sp.]